MILLDTNICIAALRHEPGVRSRLMQYTGRVFLPFVVSAELYCGVEKLARSGGDAQRARTEIDALHDAVDGVLDSSPELVHCYARLRANLESAGTPIGANDLWIAAQALSCDALLVSDNQTEFGRVPELRLDNWLGRGKRKR